jgi:hypothetical protein
MRRAELEHRTVSQVVQVALRAYVDGRYDAIEVRRTGRARGVNPPR